MNQNLYETFTSDPVEYNMKHLKTQLFMSLIVLIRQKGWSQADAAKELHVSAPRMSNLFKGHLEKFSIDTLLEMLVRVGFKLETDFTPDQSEQPLRMTLKKAML
ncbi:XRE family transcriptional regulator [Pseudomonas entomophila]|uniref:helix-turn-helix domain-containing protein n=1 Tax=Pseudomonas entomophila TaxID=312306 RepID=UPI0015E44068|nr:XRE family transcriptional regulator [Pseudomonas entomophila]MBA1195253.1 XRE family transcriptional regulator [Pseudomonas entomophila]